MSEDLCRLFSKSVEAPVFPVVLDRDLVVAPSI